MRAPFNPLAFAVVFFSFVCLLPSADLAIVGGTAYPHPGAEPIRDAVVLIDKSRITRIGPRGSVKVPRGVRVLDCSGKFILAGFWNSHVHILTPGLLRAREAGTEELNAQLDTMFNRWGFTSAFDIASSLENTLALRSRIERGDLRGPRILTAGEPLATEIPIYARDFLAAHQIRFPLVSTPEEAALRVREAARSGADAVKLFVGSLQARGKVANMPLEIVRAAAAEARRQGLPVFAHPQNMAGLEASIEGGVQILAHTAPDSPPWSDSFVDRLKRSRMALIPTLTLFDFEARKMNLSDHDREGWVGRMAAELRAFSERGGEVLFGTDVGYTDHFDTDLEFVLMSRAGLRFAEILASLTTNPANRFGYRRSGRLARGMDADITVLEADPALDARAFSKVRFTIRGGRVIYPSEFR